MSQSGERASGSIRTNVILCVLTIFSVFFMGNRIFVPTNALDPWYLNCLSGWPFAVPLLAILVAHEAGHYVASRIHRVPASLPYFLPIPFPALSPFGTMGAIILMPKRIR